MHLPDRIKSAVNRIKWASIFTRSALLSALYLTAFKFDRTQTAGGVYEGLRFRFRSIDIEALREVLIDREYEILSDFIKGKDQPVVLDLGHHIGTFALWVFAHNRRASLFGVEADPDTGRVALRNAHSGRDQGLDWRVVEGACWKNNDMLSFSNAGNPLGHHLQDAGDIAVPGLTFPEILAQVGGRADLLKLDIEGAEEAFLLAHPDCLDHVEAAVIELHPQRCDYHKVLALLEDKFSTVTPIQGRECSKPLVWCR